MQPRTLCKARARWVLAGQATHAHGEADAVGQLLEARHEHRAAVGAAVDALLPRLEALRGATRRRFSGRCAAPWHCFVHKCNLLRINISHYRDSTDKCAHCLPARPLVIKASWTAQLHHLSTAFKCFSLCRMELSVTLHECSLCCTLICSSRTRGRRYRRSVLVAVVWRLHVVQKTASSLCALAGRGRTHIAWRSHHCVQRKSRLAVSTGTCFPLVCPLCKL